MERIFRNGFLPSRFLILEIHFTYGTSIPETYFLMESLFQNHPGVQEEKYRAAIKNTPNPNGVTQKPDKNNLYTLI